MPVHTVLHLGRSGRPARGLSIVELMVALVIGLMISLAAGITAQVFMASQRQGVGVSGGSLSAASSLAALKNDVAAAGLGFFGNGNYVCNTLNFGVAGTPVSDGAAFSPVRAARVGANDRLEVVYANAVTGGAAVKLAAPSTGTTATMDTLLPVTAGQAVLMSPDAAGTPCLVRRVTATVAPTPTAKQVVTFGGAADYNSTTFATPPAFNEDAVVTLIGDLTWNTYSLVGTDLTLTRRITGASAVLMRNVIGFRVEYGASSVAAGSTTLETWEEPTGAWATIDDSNVRRVRAVRVGIVVRSPQPEKVNDVTGVCEASTAKPQLFGNVIEPDVVDWQCYRYRTQIVVVPMRNVIYGIQS